MKADEGAIARRYARAAMMYCDEHGDHDGFLQGLRTLGEALEKVPVFESLLTTTVTRRDRKQALAAEVAGMLGVSDAAKRFLDVLVVRGRVEYLPAIAARFGALLDEKHNRARADVHTPVALAEPKKQRIARSLSDRFGKEVICSFYVDETLYGGVRARVGNTIIDSSLKGRLDKLRQRIAGLTS